jgi:hypothetical protein
MRFAWRLLICMSIAVILADVLIASLYNSTLSGIPEILLLPIFTTLAVVSISVFWSILILARSTPVEFKGSFIKVSQKSVWLLQLVTSVFVLSLLINVLTTEAYNQPISSYSQIVGTVGAFMMLCILLRQLLSSLMKYRSKILFLYSIAIFTTMLYFVMIASLTYLIISSKPDSVTQTWQITHVYLPKETIQWWLRQFIPDVQDMSFILLWIASGVLFKYHFKRIMSPVFLILLSTPAVYFLGRTVDISYLIHIMGGNFVMEAIFTNIIRSVTPLISGLIFGLTFYYTSRSLPKESKLRTYLNITGHGMIITLVSSQYITILQYPYPPFGMISLTYTYMGAYLVLLGIYSTSVSSAQNIRIHNEIAKIIHERSKLSHEMGTAIFTDTVEKQVTKFEKEMEQDTGIESTPDSLEIRKYIKEIIDEKKRLGKK